MHCLLFLFWICVCVNGWALYNLDLQAVEYPRHPNKYTHTHYMRISKYNDTENIYRTNFTVLTEFPLKSKFEFTAYEKKANNDYSKIPVRVFSGYFCQFIRSDHFYYKDILTRSNLPAKCPFKKGNYFVENYRINDRYLPPELPGEHWRYDMFITYEGQDVFSMSLYIYIDRQVNTSNREGGFLGRRKKKTNTSRR